MCITTYCTSAQNSQAERDNEWGEPNRRTTDTDSLSPWSSIEPRSRTTGLDASLVTKVYQCLEIFMISVTFVIFFCHFVIDFCGIYDIL